MKYWEQIEGQKKIPPILVKREIKVFSEIERLYSKGRHLEEVIKFEKCDGLSKEILKKK